MKRIIALLSAALVFLGAAYAAPPERYEYWLDNNTEGKVTGEMTGTSFSASVPVGELSKGLHSFNFRMADSVGWGSIYRRHVYVAPLSADAAVWESWFDSDRANLQTGTVSGSSMNFNIDAATLTPGLHFFHYRMQNSYGEWGSIFRKSFLTVGNTRGANAYEYWFDTNYAAKASGTLTSGQNVYEVNVADLPRGLHFFNYRMKNGYDEWGAIYRKMFYTGTKTGWTDYEYWIDNNYAGKTAGTTDDKGNVSFSVPIGDFDRSGIHFFHLRGRNSNGEWGTVYRKLIMFYGGNDRKVLTGYRHSVNGIDLGEETVKDTIADNYLFTVDLPENVGTSIDKGMLRFNGDEVSLELSDSIYYVFQPHAVSGWGAPVSWNLPIEDNYITKVVDMAVPSSRTFEKPSRLQFHAVRFSSSDGLLSVKTSQSACFDVYKDGEKVATLSASDISNGNGLQLESGTYIGILHDVPINEENPEAEVTLKLAFDDMKAETPVLKYNGRYLTIENADADAVVKYNIDSDSDPAADGTVYDGGSIDVGGLVTVKAVAVKEGYGNSETVVLPVKGYGTEAKAMTSEKGQLTACYEWNGGKISGERFAVEGPLNGSDFEWLRAQASVRHLDVSGVANDTLPGNALALPELITVTMPRTLKAVNGKAFGDTGKLCAVELTSDGMAPANLLDGVTNRNLILYMSGAARNESAIANDGITVADGVSQLAELTEGYPFYCPKEFKAESISYTRDFTKVTGIDGDCAGWETIALPFAVETVSHAKGELKPFSVDPETEQLRYWLYAPDAYEWLRADEIQAYRPYLIAMPNNPAYYEPFNVGGTVTFSAKNATVAVTPDNLGFDFKGNRKLYANFMPKEVEAGILPVNDETYEYGGVSYVPGSQFVAGVRAVRPFEAYLQAEHSLTRASIFSRSEVEDLMADMDMKVWSEGKVICIRAGFSAKIRVYDTTGQLVRIADVKAGETSRVDDLNAGIYIVGNFKILIK